MQNGSTYSVLVRVQTGKAPMAISVEASQKVRNKFVIMITDLYYSWAYSQGLYPTRDACPSMFASVLFKIAKKQPVNWLMDKEKG